VLLLRKTYSEKRWIDVTCGRSKSNSLVFVVVWCAVSHGLSMEPMEDGMESSGPDELDRAKKTKLSLLRPCSMGM
jgi:hypothetical protein